MANESTELRARDKEQAEPAVEQTRAGRIFIPAVDIFETEREITLIADMPGVAPEKLDIDLREDTLTLSGEVEPLEGQTEEPILREYATGNFFRQFSLSEVIDQERIDARLNDGILRLSLPKVEKAKPRKISVQAG